MPSDKGRADRIKVKRSEGEARMGRKRKGAESGERAPALPHLAPLYKVKWTERSISV